MLPDRGVVDATVKLIDDHAPSIYTWSYERERPQLVALYNKANASQWNSVTELDWDTDVDRRGARRRSQDTPVLRLVRAAAEVPGSPLVSSWSQRGVHPARPSSCLTGQPEPVHARRAGRHAHRGQDRRDRPVDRRQVLRRHPDDGRGPHTEVFARYLDTKLGNPYPMGRELEAQITSLLEDARWDIAYLGMQIVIESLALAAFGDMLRRTDEPLLHKLLRYVLADEARHVAFGIVSLGELYRDLSAAELKERQEFLVDSTQRSRTRALNGEVWERMGTSLEAVWPALKEARASTTISPTGSFERAFFAKLVPNVRKLGLLDANDGYLRRRWAEVGMLEFEFADDTSADYESYDAVAQDRATQ